MLYLLIFLLGLVAGIGIREFIAEERRLQEEFDQDMELYGPDEEDDSIDYEM